MSKFFVGQRVRVARTPGPEYKRAKKSWGAKVGDEGYVAGTAAHPNRGFYLYRHCDISVKLDHLPEAAMGPSYCFEPIIPEGAQPSEFTTLHDLLTSLEGVAA